MDYSLARVKRLEDFKARTIQNAFPRIQTAAIETPPTTAIATPAAPTPTKVQKVVTDVIWDGTTLYLKYQMLTVVDTGTADATETINVPGPC